MDGEDNYYTLKLQATTEPLEMVSLSTMEYRSQHMIVTMMTDDRMTLTWLLGPGGIQAINPS